MVSTPSYDPNRLSGHDGAATSAAWDELNADPDKPMLNRAISQTYPPGSTFKVVVTAAALESGVTPDTQLTAAPNITLPDTATTLENYDGATCGGAPTVSLREAFARSCNTAFVELGIDTGADALVDQAEALGIGRTLGSAAAGRGQHHRRPSPTRPLSARRASGSATWRSPRSRTRRSPRPSPTVVSGWSRTWSRSLQGPDLAGARGHRHRSRSARPFRRRSPRRSPI